LLFGQEDAAKDLVREMFLQAFRKLKGGQLELTTRPRMMIPFWQDQIVT
jgi:hypothetical protein